jgi:transposase
MSQINNIRDLAQKGYQAGEISEKTGHDVKTIKKYLAVEDFSPEPPLEKENPSKLDAYKEIILSWLEEDKKHWRKQHHTAKRIQDRLEEEVPGYHCSYSLVQRYVKKVREEMRQKANQELVWHPGEAQVDFGEADFCETGRVVRKKYLTVSFPYSNDGYSQVFGGETAECVCQGLKDIFEYIGGVPTLLVFDNATGVGRRVGEKIREAELFKRFRAHYGFPARFCNAEAGWEKGNVERKVGYNRSNLFVPVPRYGDIETYNRQLLEQHKKKAQELHYKKLLPIVRLFEDDVAALHPLPSKPFNVCRYSWEKTDGYGKVCLEGKHHYSTRPEMACQEVLLGIRAHTVEVLNSDGSILTVHERQFGEQRTDTTDHSTSLAVLMRNVGAWHNSGIREQVTGKLREILDEQPRQQLKETLKMMHTLSQQYGFDAAVEAMEEAISRDRLNFCDATILAARITGYGLFTPPEIGPPLTVYDEAFLGAGGNNS